MDCIKEVLDMVALMKDEYGLAPYYIKAFPSHGKLEYFVSNRGLHIFYFEAPESTGGRIEGYLQVGYDGDFLKELYTTELDEAVKFLKGGE